jgi:hypothetical protein
MTVSHLPEASPGPRHSEADISHALGIYAVEGARVRKPRMPRWPSLRRRNRDARYKP